MLTSHMQAQQFTDDPFVQGNFLGMNNIGSGVGDVTQMTFGPDGGLYVATFSNGVKRYDYDLAGNLTNETTVWSRPQTAQQFNGSLGVAFHEDPLLGTVMYIAPAVSSGFDVELNITQSILRLTDGDGDGNWGEAGEVNQAIVDNLRVTDLHQVDQLLVDGDTLYVNIGSRTRTGGERSEYGGGPNPDDGEFAYTGALNWLRDLNQLSSDTTTPNLAGFDIVDHHLDTRPFTSSDTGKLTIHSTGFRNNYGIALDGDGDLWITMNQNESPLKPDELHQTNFLDDHRFPKGNEVSGDWKQNSDAVAAGFFQTFKDPVATLGEHASADGITFTDRNDFFAEHAFLVRYAQGDDLLAVDTNTGEVVQVVSGFSNPLDVATDPEGNLLVGDHGGGGTIYRLSLLAGMFGDLDESGVIDAGDWTIVRDNYHADLSGLTSEQTYSLGDLNRDLVNDEFDFAVFKSVYEAANGINSFAALATVPEPGSATLLFCLTGVFLASAVHRKRIVPE